MKEKRKFSKAFKVVIIIFVCFILFELGFRKSTYINTVSCKCRTDTYIFGIPVASRDFNCEMAEYLAELVGDIDRGDYIETSRQSIVSGFGLGTPPGNWIYLRRLKYLEENKKISHETAVKLAKDLVSENFIRESAIESIDYESMSGEGISLEGKLLPYGYPDVKPDTVEKAIDILIVVLPEEQKEGLAGTKKEELITYYFTLGRWVRCNFGLWKGNEALMKELGGGHPNEASMVLIEILWKKLRLESANNRKETPEEEQEKMYEKLYDYALENISKTEEIVLKLEEIYECRKLNISYERINMDTKYRRAKNILAEINDPALLREVLYLCEYKCGVWSRLLDQYALKCPEGDLYVDMSSAVPSRLAELKTDESMKMLIELLDSRNWDGGFSFDIGGAITECGKDILPYLEEYIKQNEKATWKSSDADYAKKMIKYINEGKIYEP